MIETTTIQPGQQYSTRKMSLVHNFKTIAVERRALITNYPESFTKLHTTDENTAPTRKNFKKNYQVNKELFKIVLDSGATISCTKGYFQGGCENGHKFLKAVYCGREWCESCGEDGSPSHLRRMARWMPKVQQFKEMAYVVITIPKEIRGHFKQPAALSDFRTFVKRRFEREGVKRGLIRYHWFGDCNRCKGKGCKACNDTGSGNDYNPHLNVLIDGGYIPRHLFNKYAEDWRNSLAAYFLKVTGKTVSGQFKRQTSKSQEHKMHHLKYITRSTHRIYNQEIADNLKGYRTTSTWGKWPKKETNSDAAGELSSELISIVNGFCPCCAEKITWNVGHYINDPITGKRKFKRVLIKVNSIRGGTGGDMQHMEAGYYILNN